MTDDVHAQAAEIMTSYVAHNQIEPGQVPVLLQSLIDVLMKKYPQAEVTTRDPGQTVFHDYLICLEDGAKVKMLRRYLSSRFGMTPEDYIRKWGLPDDYPMVCPSYSEKRRQIALDQGLGTSHRPE